VKNGGKLYSQGHSNVVIVEYYITLEIRQNKLKKPSFVYIKILC